MPIKAELYSSITPLPIKLVTTGIFVCCKKQASPFFIFSDWHPPPTRSIGRSAESRNGKISSNAEFLFSVGQENPSAERKSKSSRCTFIGKSRTTGPFLPEVAI